MHLYLFNPENDLAVANGAPYYMAPPLARQIAIDLAILPSWFATSPAAVWIAQNINWMESEKAQLGITTRQLSSTQLVDEVSCIEQVIPWGWSTEVAMRFAKLGIASSLLLDVDKLDKQRTLSHRSLTIAILNSLEQEKDVNIPHQLPNILYTPQEVQHFVESQPHLLLKAPWSGSGKGLYWGRGVYDTTLERWSNGILKRQGEVIGEYHFDKVVDFAMEFYSDGCKAAFAGYSLFDTNVKGVYNGNTLASNEQIEAQLAMHVSRQSLQQLQYHMAHTLSRLVAPHYQGYLGVDMMLYRCPLSHRIEIHPCIEVNLRMNMGMVARLFYDRYVAPTSLGSYTIDFEKEEGVLLASHHELQKSNPLVIEDGKIVRGYLSLCPLHTTTHYRARVEVIQE